MIRSYYSHLQPLELITIELQWSSGGAGVRM